VGDDDELGPGGVLAQERQEAVDVEVVECRFDLVEYVERARTREEHREQEGECGHRLLAAGQQRQALALLAGRRDLDLDPQQILLGGQLAVGLFPLPLLRRRLGVDALRRSGLAAEHARGSLALGHEPQPPAAAGKQLGGQLLERAGGGIERLLKRRLDLAVGIGDQLLELSQRGLQVATLGLELLDVGHGFGVLLLRERVDRAELLSAARHAAG
jgi:hypothetical protein